MRRWAPTKDRPPARREGRATQTLADHRAAAASRRRYLRDVTACGGHLRLAAALLVLDAAAAIGFAGGLAGAVSAIVAHSSMLLWLALLLMCGLARAALAAAAMHAGAWNACEAKSALRRRIAIAIFHRPPQATSAGAALTATVDEVEAIEGYVARFVPARVAATLAPLLILVAVAMVSRVSALILAATLIPFIAAMILAGGAAADESRRQFEAMARLSGIFVDRIRGLPVILAFRAGNAEAVRIGRAADEVADRTLRVLARAFLSSAALEFFAALSVALVAVYAGFALLGLLPFSVPEPMTLARAFFVLVLAPEFYAPLRRLAAAYHDKQAAETVADRLAPIEALAPAAAHARPMPVATPPAIRFDKVSIRYPGTEHPAVERLSFDVASGETVALVGASGSGKTSLLNLLLGLAPLAGGLVTIDGEPLEERTMVMAGYAGQSPILIAGTLADNIALGAPSASRTEIARAATDAGLLPLVDRREHGLDCRLDERGGGLSGGERRRVALARALLSQSSLLLLDEPTAHLDADAEAELIATIARARIGKTVLVATHSKALAQVADRIVEVGSCN